MATDRNGFHTTRWTIVEAAGATDTEAARTALVVLCETYWYPLYTFLRRSGHDAPDAEDLTQGFLARVLDRRDLGGARPERGRFRTYLLGALKHYLQHERDAARALKRGGGAPVLSIDFADADRRFQLEAPESSNAEWLFERQWALAVLGRALTRLETTYAGGGQAALFTGLRPALLGGADGPRDRLAAELGMTTGAVNTALHRLRARFRDALRSEVADTVSTASEVEDELRFLREVLGRGL